MVKSSRPSYQGRHLGGRGHLPLIFESSEKQYIFERKFAKACMSNLILLLLERKNRFAPLKQVEMTSRLAILSQKPEL